MWLNESYTTPDEINFDELGEEDLKYEKEAINSSKSRHELLITSF